jgi:PhoH-like ATPase
MQYIVDTSAISHAIFNQLLQSDQTKSSEPEFIIPYSIAQSPLFNRSILTNNYKITFTRETGFAELYLEVFHIAQQYQDVAFISNDRKNIQLIKQLTSIKCQYVKELIPSGINTGVINSFLFNDNLKPVFINAYKEHEPMKYKHKPWGVDGNSIYQDMFISLLMNENLNVISCSSPPGYGKTFLALAAALDQVFEKKLFHKIYIIKPIIEVGESLGFLPGNTKDKITPHFEYLNYLFNKLFQYKEGSIDNVVKTIPVNYTRGNNFNNSIVIIDEMQNLSRYQARTVLSRIGYNSKAICLGDINQIDNKDVNKQTNGLTCVIRKLIGQKSYAHITLKGKNARGEICDMINKTGL